MRMVVALYIGDSSAGAVSGVPNTAYPIPCTPQKYPHRGMTDGPVHIRMSLLHINGSAYFVNAID